MTKPTKPTDQFVLTRSHETKISNQQAFNWVEDELFFGGPGIMKMAGLSCLSRVPAANASKQALTRKLIESIISFE